MAIRADSFPVFIGVLILVLGAPGPVRAEFSLEPVIVEQAAVPPPSEGLEDPTLSEERRVAGYGSAPVAAPSPEIVVREDPLADAFGAPEAALSVPVSVRPEYEVALNDRIRHFIERFTGSRRSVVSRWLDRSGRYLGMIRNTLRRHGMPEDLAFTAMIESGFNPVAVSRAGAKGLWQFMAQTARRYGLRVDNWVDERLDPEKSTVAAVAYLRDLYNQFGSWILAQAAYNAGELKVARAIQLARTTDFWELASTRHLRNETKDFVPMIQAATLIGRDPDRYGFDVGSGEPHRFDRVRVPPSTDLRHLSHRSGLSVESLRTLNPELWRGVTPPGVPYELKVPEGGADLVRAASALPERPARPAITAKPRTVHVVQPRDTVSGIARKYGVSTGDILRLNSLANDDLIRPGDRLRVATLQGSAER